MIKDFDQINTIFTTLDVVSLSVSCHTTTLSEIPWIFFSETTSSYEEIREIYLG